MDEPWRHYAKWNKPDTKGQKLYDSTGKFVESENRIMVTRCWEDKGVGNYCLKEKQFHYGTMKMF